MPNKVLKDNIEKVEKLGVPWLYMIAQSSPDIIYYLAKVQK